MGIRETFKKNFKKIIRKIKKINLKLLIKLSLSFIYHSISVKVHRYKQKKINNFNILSNLKDNLKTGIQCYKN